MLLLSRRHLSGTLSSEVNLAKSPSSLLGDEKVLLGGKGEKDGKALAEPAVRAHSSKTRAAFQKLFLRKHSNSAATVISQTIASVPDLHSGCHSCATLPHCPLHCYSGDLHPDPSSDNICPATGHLNLSASKR